MHKARRPSPFLPSSPFYNATNRPRTIPAFPPSSTPKSPFVVGYKPRARQHSVSNKPPKAPREHNLYKTAITQRMRKSPEGQKILLLGPRLAVATWEATRTAKKVVDQIPDLERDVKENQRVAVL